MSEKFISKSTATMQETLADIANIVENRLRRFFEELEENTQNTWFDTMLTDVPAAQVMDLTLRPAKRLRATLVWAGAALFDPHAARGSAVIDTAAVMELLQSYLLIHDDIMDGSDTRRGGPSVHITLGAYAGNKKLGDALGILAGDQASAFAQLLLADLEVDDSIARQVQKIIAKMHLDVIHGQSLDMLEEVSAYEIALHKTASYTTIGPLASGATLVGARESEIDALAKAAAVLGVAFQFRDDVLSTFGDPSRTGKSADTDLLEGKRTVLIEEARARADRLQWKRIEAVLGNPDAAPEAVAAARDAIVRCGAKAACETHVSELTEEFIQAMQRNYFGVDAKHFLIQLAKYLGERET